MELTETIERPLTHAQCNGKLSAMGDALYVIGGKWKLRIIIALKDSGKKRFNDLQRTVTGISARVLSNELKELEMNGFVRRIVHTDAPVTVEYELTGYSDTLNDVLQSLVEWGRNAPCEDQGRKAVRGQFYENPDYPKGTVEMEEQLQKAKVFHYSAIEVFQKEMHGRAEG